MPGTGRSGGVAGLPGNGPGSDMRPAAVPGWYPDPAAHAPQRYWSGQAWTSWVAVGPNVWSDPTWARRPAVRGDLEALRFVDDVFLREAHERASLSAAQIKALLVVVADLTAQAQAQAQAQAPSVPVVPRALIAPVAPVPIAPIATPRSVRVPVVPAPFVPLPDAGVHRATPQFATPQFATPQFATPPVWPRPAPALSPRALWWARARGAIGSDLAVHGLAYLGVLMLFVGMFGLVAFAFGEVTPGLRPVAELGCAVLPFAAAQLLRRHGAEVVGRALEIVGGLLVPLMVTASVVDGFAFPRDLSGPTLVVALTLLGGTTAAGYAEWSRTHPASGLRFLVGPALWFTAAMATLGTGRAVPTGEGVAVPTGAQVAAMTAALVATVVVARRRPRLRLSGPALTAALPGTVVLGALALLTGVAQGWPPIPVALAGIGILAAAELQRVRVPARVLDVVLPGWWAGITLALLSGSPHGGAAALSAAVFLTLVEVLGRRGRPAVALLAPAAGLVVCLVAVTVDPWWAVGTFTVASAWAVARRTRWVRPAALALDAAVAVLPLAAVLSLTAALSSTAGLLAATALTALATVPATRPVLRRTAGDLFWRRWWVGALVVVALGAQVAFVADGASQAARWVVVAVFAILATLGVLGPLAPTARPWVVTALAGWAWILTCEVAGLPDGVRGGVLAVAGLALVVAAHLAWPTATGASPVRAAIGLAGHALTLVALALAGSGLGLVVATAAATAGLVVTGARDDRDRSLVGRALARVGGSARYLPWVLASVGGVVAVWLALDVAGLVALADPWASAVLAAAAVGYAGVARASRPDRRVATMTWAGFTAGILAVVTARAAWPAVVALAAVVVCVVLVPPARRAPVMRWVAWGAVAPWVGLLAGRCVPWFAALEPATAATLTLVAVGGALVIAAAATDLRGRAWVPRWAPVHRAAVPPLVLGAIEVGTGLLFTVVLPPAAGGSLTLVVALVVLATALLARAGSLGGVAAILAWGAVVRLIAASLDTRPWICVLVAAVLLLAGEALHRLTPDRQWWVRWDVPLLIAAAPVALTALAAAADGDAFTATFVVVGLLAVAVAVRVRAVPGLGDAVGLAGTCTILLGAWQAGGGWLALALLALSAAHTALAVPASAVPAVPASAVQAVRVAAGAAAGVAGWCAVLAWSGWPAQLAGDMTVVVGGTGVLIAAVVASSRGRGGVFVWTWGATGVLVGVSVGLASLGLPGVAPSAGGVIGALAMAAGLAIAAAPLRVAALRDAAGAALLTGLLVALAVGGAAPGARVGVLAVIAVSLALTLLAAGRRVSSSPWARPAAELGGAAAVVAILGGLAQLPDGMVLVPGIAAAAVWVAAVGVAWRQV
ncbi:DUF2510 domain-containing protein [Pengzhenrongella phosphoraccumulans]|uniref:DUF2510 domain-containing protein n=1 Tax=Pengzhenrongella phosphoraccumulans TaxID=3114394 RepID=UPI00388EC0A2